MSESALRRILRYAKANPQDPVGLRNKGPGGLHATQAEGGHCP